MKINLRDYTQDDWPSLENIILNAENFGQAFLETEKRNISIFAAHPEYGRVVIAEDVSTRQVLGYASAMIEWKAFVISSIITHHRFLRKGVGRTLIEGIEEIAKSHPIIDVIRVDTGDFMDYAQEFYKSCGFSRVGHVPHYLSWNNNQVIFVFPVKNEPTEEDGAEGEIWILTKSLIKFLCSLMICSIVIGWLPKWTKNRNAFLRDTYSLLFFSFYSMEYSLYLAWLWMWLF